MPLTRTWAGSLPVEMEENGRDVLEVELAGFPVEFGGGDGEGGEWTGDHGGTGPKAMPAFPFRVMQSLDSNCAAF